MSDADTQQVRKVISAVMNTLFQQVLTGVSPSLSLFTSISDLMNCRSDCCERSGYQLCLNRVSQVWSFLCTCQWGDGFDACNAVYVRDCHRELGALVTGDGEAGLKRGRRLYLKALYSMEVDDDDKVLGSACVVAGHKYLPITSYCALARLEDP
jgi:hypothetical protein